jgi:hypothetical protein
MLSVIQQQQGDDKPVDQMGSERGTPHLKLFTTT